MKEQNLTKWAGQQYRLKVSKLINSVTIAQTVADQTLQFADKCMTAQEREDSDACRAMENLSCVCEETLRVLCEELNRGTRLYEVLESGTHRSGNTGTTRLTSISNANWQIKF